MDPNETAAMTEASGLVDPERTAPTSTRPSSASDRSAQPFDMPSQEDMERWAEKLREVTVKAPLRLLFAAFVLGLLVVRRR